MITEKDSDVVKAKKELKRMFNSDEYKSITRKGGYKPTMPLNPKASSNYNEILGLVPVSRRTLTDWIRLGYFPKHTHLAGKKRMKYWSNKDVISWLKDPELWIESNMKKQEEEA